MYVKNGRVETKGFSDMTRTDAQGLYSLRWSPQRAGATQLKNRGSKEKANDDDLSGSARMGMGFVSLRSRIGNRLHEGGESQ